jgi:hypothetical protein
MAATPYLVRFNTPATPSQWTNLACGAGATQAQAVALADALVVAGAAQAARVVTAHNWDQALHYVAA